MPLMSERAKRLLRSIAGSDAKSRHVGGAVAHEMMEQQTQRADSDVVRDEQTDVHVGIASHRGPRDRNEDSAAVSWQGDFLAISDGIGGAPFGDVMSCLACNAAVAAYDSGADVHEAFETANEVASLVAGLLGERSGATLLLAQRSGTTLTILSAGDTRGYLLRDCELMPITLEGRIAPGSNALGKAIGYGPIEPDETSVELACDDRVVLCTDGVWEYLTQERITEVLAGAPNAPLAAEDLSWEASRVGQDNATCVVVFVDDMEETCTPKLDAYGPHTPSTAYVPGE